MLASWAASNTKRPRSHTRDSESSNDPLFLDPMMHGTVPYFIVSDQRFLPPSLHVPG